MFQLAFDLLKSIRPVTCIGIALLGAAAYDNVNDVMTITMVFMAILSACAACILLSQLGSGISILPKSILQSSSAAFGLFFIGASVYLGINQIAIAGGIVLVAIAMLKMKPSFPRSLVVGVGTAMVFLYGGLLNEFDYHMTLLMVSTGGVILATQTLNQARRENGDAPGKLELQIVAVVILGYVIGTVPLVIMISEDEIYSIFIITMLAMLWIPLVIRLLVPTMDWILVHFSPITAFFGLMIAMMFLR